MAQNCAAGTKTVTQRIAALNTCGAVLPENECFQTEICSGILSRVKRMSVIFLLGVFALSAMLNAMPSGGHFAHPAAISGEHAAHSTDVTHVEHAHHSADQPCAADDCCHSHGASIACEIVRLTTTHCGHALATNRTQKLPSSAPNRIERPQWIPAV